LTLPTSAHSAGTPQTSPEDYDVPIRLRDAVQQFFPHGGMTVSGLRTEARKGRLVIERIAGKDFVTHRAIDEMRRLCRTNPNLASTSENTYISERDALLARLATPSSCFARQPSGDVEGGAAQDALRIKLQRRRRRGTPAI